MEVRTEALTPAILRYTPFLKTSVSKSTKPNSLHNEARRSQNRKRRAKQRYILFISLVNLDRGGSWSAMVVIVIWDLMHQSLCRQTELIGIIESGSRRNALASTAVLSLS